ncbi:MAG TPA: alpha/beta fold hydrolase, partial [Verrucomicrobiae bacterium]
MAKTSVIVIHGGSCWTSYQEYLSELKHSHFEVDFSPRIGWQRQLQKNLGAGFKVLSLEMPNWQNAKYREWKIWYEKAAAVAKDPIVVGHSLGAIFVAKYFAETVRPRKARGIFLVSAPYKTQAEDRDFGDFALQRPPRRLGKIAEPIFFYHSQDDAIVEIENLNPYRELVPRATVRIFKNRGHFIQDRFPELVAD